MENLVAETGQQILPAEKVYSLREWGQNLGSWPRTGSHILPVETVQKGSNRGALILLIRGH